MKKTIKIKITIFHYINRIPIGFYYFQLNEKFY